MKKIEAIVRTSKYEEVKEALRVSGIELFSFWDVRGVGKQSDSKLYRGTVYDDGQIERRMISIVINDAFLEKCIGILTKSASTAEIGDGKIFVSEIDDVIRIRNGERGPEAVYYKKPRI